jgi:hypothetical protein
LRSSAIICRAAAASRLSPMIFIGRFSSIVRIWKPASSP